MTILYALPVEFQIAEPVQMEYALNAPKEAICSLGLQTAKYATIL